MNTKETIDIAWIYDLKKCINLRTSDVGGIKFERQVACEKLRLEYYKIIIHSASADASADLSADLPENRLIKLKIILKHSRML